MTLVAGAQSLCWCCGSCFRDKLRGGEYARASGPIHTLGPMHTVMLSSHTSAHRLPAAHARARAHGHDTRSDPVYVATDRGQSPGHATNSVTHVRVAGGRPRILLIPPSSHNGAPAPAVPSQAPVRTLDGEDAAAPTSSGAARKSLSKRRANVGPLI